MTHSKFLHYFPIPSFLRMSATGFSIDDSYIRFIEIIDADGQATVTKYGAVQLPPQAVVEGEIINAAALEAALVSIRREHNVRFSQFSLPDDKMYIFKLRLPSIPDKEIRSALEFKLEENIPMAAPEAVFDYAVLGAESSGIDVVVCAAARTTSLGYCSVFKLAGIQPLRFGSEAQAVANAVVSQDELGIVLVVNFFSHKTTISIVENSVVQFSLSMRKNELVNADVDQNALLEKSQGSLSRFAQDLPSIKQEIERVLNYWRDKTGQGDLSYKVIISGEEALNPEFVENFGKAIGIGVQVANPWCNVFSDEKHIPPIPRDESFKYAAAIGSALGHRLNPRHNV